MNQFLNKYKKPIVIILILAFIFPCGFLAKPQKAEAGFPVTVVWDIPRDIPIPSGVKENILDTVFWIIAKLMIKTLTNSIVNWINSGFEGSPTFVTNPGAYFGDLADQASGVFIHQLGAEGLLCSPFRLPILASLELSYRTSTLPRFQCTLGAAKENWQRNWDEFMYDFTNGGWDRWLNVTTQPQNNPYGAYLMAYDELQARRLAAEQRGKSEVNWGSGFVSLKENVGGKYLENLTDEDFNNLNLDEDQYDLLEQYESEGKNLDNLTDEEFNKLGLSSGQHDQLTAMNFGEPPRYENTTPGNIIADQLKINLGSSVRQLEAADEIGEALAAILNALINQLIGSGLRSLSDTSHGGSGEWQSTLPTADEKKTIIKLIDSALQSEIDYRSTKQKSVNAYSSAIAKAEDLKECYENQILLLRQQSRNSEADALQSVINNKLVPLINDLTSQRRSFELAVQNSDSLISLAEDLKSRAGFITNYDELDNLLKEFKDELQPQLHNAGDVAAAESEYNDVIKPYLTEIIYGDGIQGIDQMYQQCLAGL